MTLFEKTDFTGQLANSGSYFVFQDSVIVYSQATEESEPVTKLTRATPLEIVTNEEASAYTLANWRKVAVPDGAVGYIKSKTKLATTESLLCNREELVRGIAHGKAVMVIGILLTVAGAGVSIWSFMSQSTVVILHGIVIVGIANLFWGIEQRSFARRSLDKFDVDYSAVLYPTGFRS